MIKWQGGRRPSTPLTSVSIMCDDMAKRTTKSKRTFRFYRESIQIIVKDLESVGRPILPWDLREEDIKALMQIWQDRGLTVATRRGYVSAMRVWLHYWHNTTIDGMEIRCELAIMLPCVMRYGFKPRGKPPYRAHTHARTH